MRISKLLIFLLLFGYGYSQEQDFTPDYLIYHEKYTPETPNASTFTIYGNTPVNHATGIPQIDIPLFTIEEDGVSVPISLSYHASGVKVDELASVVGLKWTLNAGGGIFRQVNDKPDEEGWLVPNLKGFVTPEWIASQGQIDKWQVQKQIGHSDHFHDYFPDDFNYRFLNQSGTFIFNQDGTTEKEKQSPITIKKIPGVGNSIYFKATDQMGTVYHFDNSNMREINSKLAITGSNIGVGTTTDAYITGWMIDKLVTKNNKQINFTYTHYDLDYTINDASHSISVAPGCEANRPPCGCNGFGINDNTTVSTTTIRYNNRNQLIKTIETTNVKATFNYSLDTTLSTWQKKLDSITILDKIANKTKSYNFTYGKFSGDPRLRLDQIQEIGFDGSAKPAYKFYYQRGSLPLKGSMSKDYHGYYNGKGNSTLVPYSLNAYNVIARNYRRSLANRRENLNSLKIGTLNKIEYPTGGSTTFSYEANAVPSTTNANPRIIPRNIAVHASGEYFTSGGYRVFRAPFTLSDNLLGNLGSSVSYGGTSTICNFDPAYPSIDCSRFNIYPKQQDGSLGAPIFSPFKVIGAEGSVGLSKGDYVLELKVEESKLIANPTALISIHLDWEEKETENTTTRYTGGLRVKSIVDKNTNDSITRETQYTYDGLVGYSLDVTNTMNNYGENAVFSAENIALNPALIKSGYFYKKVTINKIGSNDTIKTVEKYTETFQNKSYDPQLLEQEFYDQNNLIKKTIYSYTNDIIKTSQFWSLSDRILCFIPEGGSKPMLGYTYPNLNHYYHRRNVLTKRTEIEYFNKNNEPFSAAVTQYKYQYNNDMQVIKEEMDGRLYAENEQAIQNGTYGVYPDGKLLKIQYTYPVDHQLENPALSTLHNDHKVSLPVSKTVYDNNNMIQGQFIDYDAQGNVIATYRHHKGKATHQSTAGHIPSDYELHQRFTLQAGKPVEVQQKDGTPIAILWDTTHTYVLAELTGVTHTELHAVTAAVNLKTTTKPQLTTLYTTLRTSFPQAQITTYIHDPLKGVVAITDPRGYVTQYEYDGLSRLTSVKDQDNFLISAQQYHYKN